MNITKYLPNKLKSISPSVLALALGTGIAGVGIASNMDFTAPSSTEPVQLPPATEPTIDPLRRLQQRIMALPKTPEGQHTTFSLMMKNREGKPLRALASSRQQASDSLERLASGGYKPTGQQFIQRYIGDKTTREIMDALQAKRQDFRVKAASKYKIAEFLEDEPKKPHWMHSFAGPAVASMGTAALTASAIGDKTMPLFKMPGKGLLKSRLGVGMGLGLINTLLWKALVKGYSGATGVDTKDIVS